MKGARHAKMRIKGGLEGGRNNKNQGNQMPPNGRRAIRMWTNILIVHQVRNRMARQQFGSGKDVSLPSLCKLIVFNTRIV